MVKDMRVAARQDRVQRSHQTSPPPNSEEHVSSEISGQAAVPASLESLQAVAHCATDLLSLIGNTPLLRMHKIGAEYPEVDLCAKAEWANPGGSGKDRPDLNNLSYAACARL